MPLQPPARTPILRHSCSEPCFSFKCFKWLLALSDSVITLSSALSDDDVNVAVGGITVVEDSNAIMLLCDLYDDVYGDLFNVVTDSVNTVLDTIAISTSIIIIIMILLMSTADAADGVNIATTTGTVTVLIIHVFLSSNAAAALPACHSLPADEEQVTSNQQCLYGWDHSSDSAG